MTKDGPEKSRLEKLSHCRALRWVGGIAVALVLALTAASYLFDEPLRAMMEKQMNHDLKGYTVRLPGLHLQPIGLSLTLKGLTVLQLAHPEPPIVQFPTLKASIQWRSILSGRLVAMFALDRPRVNINLQQLESEAADTSSLKERGWQQVVEDIYPLKIDTVKVDDASITYIDQDPKKPLVLSHLNLQATNIRNLHLPDNVYPSSFHLDTAIFDTGLGSIDGAANFLSEPYPGIKGRVTLDKVPMDYFSSLLARKNLNIRGGVLRASGSAEYAANVKNAHLENLDIQGMKIDYVHSKGREKLDKKRVVKLGKAAKKLNDKPGMLIRADKLSLTGCNIGMVNETSGKKYRLFLADTDLQLNNYSNQSQGAAQARLKAKFMGSGITTASLNFRSDRVGPDLDLHLRVEDSQLTALNDVLRAYGDFDVTAGSFSLISELHVKNGTISGYVKPFFKDMKVYDKVKDKKRGVMHQMYEMMIGGAAGLLENRKSQEVATKATIRGKVGSPETSGWQIVGQLLKNAFFKALLPSFETGPSGAGRR